MNLTSTILLIKRWTPIILALLIILILIIIIFIRYNPKPSVPTPPAQPTIYQNPIQKQPREFNFTKTQIPNIPEKLPVFIAKKYDLSSEVAKDIASGFGITSEPNFSENTLDGKQYNWSQHDTYLTVSQTNIRYENRQSLIIANTSTIFDENGLQNIARNFMQKIPLTNQDLTINSSKTKYFNIGKEGYSSTDSLANAQIIEFSYDKNLFNYPLITNSPDSPYTVIRLKKTGEIFYFETRFFNNFLAQDSFQLKPIKLAINQVAAGQGKIVQTSILDRNKQALELYRNLPVDLQMADVTGIHLVYLLPNNPAETIQPIYVFEGEFQKGTERGKIVIYLPAL